MSGENFSREKYNPSVKTDLAPERRDAVWRLEQINKGTSEALGNVVENISQNISYDQIRRILVAYEGKKWEGGDKSSPENSAAGILAIQAALRFLNYPIKHVDGRFGPETKGWLLTFQQDWNDKNPAIKISVDGSPGPNTMNALIRALNKRQDSDAQGLEVIAKLTRLDPYISTQPEDVDDSDLHDILETEPGNDDALFEKLEELETQLLDKLNTEEDTDEKHILQMNLTSVQSKILDLVDYDLDKFTASDKSEDWSSYMGEWETYLETKVNFVETLSTRAKNILYEIQTTNFSPTTPPSSQ